jgi:hypothetical protein
MRLTWATDDNLVVAIASISVLCFALGIVGGALSKNAARLALSLGVRIFLYRDLAGRPVFRPIHPAGPDEHLELIKTFDPPKMRPAFDSAPAAFFRPAGVGRLRARSCDRKAAPGERRIRTFGSARKGPPI